MRISRDRRGQSVVVGAVVLFGFLVLALSLYQVQVVPQQSGQTEFEHFEAVQNDLVELRNGILSAGSSERPQFVDVKLGTSYQTRVFAVNPPNPGGTLRTSDPYNITITDSSGTTVNVSTRFVQFRPGYNELQVGSTWYENSVLYLDERDAGSRTVIIEDQNLVTDNDTLRITALQNEFQASGTRRVAIELYPADNATDLSQLSGELNVSIPTRLGEEAGYWNESIENGSVTYLAVDDTAYPSSADVSALRLQVDSPDNITVNSVGIRSEPSEEPVRDNLGSTESGGDGDTLPPGAVAYRDANGNNRYDSDETTYAESDFDSNGGGPQGDFGSETIILEKDISVSKLDLVAGSFTAQNVQIETTSDSLEISTKRNIDMRRSTVEAATNSSLALKASQDVSGSTIDIRNTVLISSEEMTAETDSGDLRFNDPGTKIQEANEDEQTLTLSSGVKNGEDDVDQPEVGTINTS
ncbi:hypothetical protein BRD22_06860 [Halobacteriales archaeon SW_8_68_21]|nr:MAG: hypothetical protein BRD22_06860 [Halobacteriales archaeon SW_8_68_21]